MAELRLNAALVALTCGALGAGCGSAGAEPGPTSGLTPPAGWQALPEVAAAARAALGKDAAIDGVEAWGETARGCYAVWMALRGPGTAQGIAEQVLGGLTPPATGPDRRDDDERPPPPARKLDLSDVVKPIGAAGVLSFSFAAPPYQGRLRARLGGGRVTALACFANQREPIACAAACNGVLGSLP
jgi:hypothetical protein